MEKKLLVRTWFSAGLLAGAGCLCSCAVFPQEERPLIRLSPNVRIPQRTGLVLWVDGLEGATFDRLQQAGRLPNITRYLIDRGVTIRQAVVSVPTITYANNVSFNTGLLPGHHGITDNEWFDPVDMVLQDYRFIRTYQQADGDFTAPTIHEMLVGEFTATIFTPVRRGATRNIDNWASAGIAWFFGFQNVVTQLTALRFELISDLANRSGRWPTFILAYFAAPDTIAHQYGVSSPEYERQLLDIDRQVGRICRSLEEAGLLERTVITLVTDHGVVDTPNHTDLAGFFRWQLGVPVDASDVGPQVPFEQRLDHFNNFRAVVTVGGDRHSAIHLRCGEHWWQRPSEQDIDGFAARFCRPGAGGQAADSATLPDLLARLPATELVVVRRGQGSIRVQNAEGSGVIERQVRDGRKLYRYTLLRGPDPLGYTDFPAAKALEAPSRHSSRLGDLMNGQFHDGAAWLAASLETGKPDCVVQLVEMNDSPRSGDVALFARDGWDFGVANCGGHGGLSRRELLVPWFWAGPDLPAGTSIPCARTVDLLPTMLHLIGRQEAIPPGLDGRSIVDDLRGAAASSQPTTAAAE